jgi:hypothetical protein
MRPPFGGIARTEAGNGGRKGGWTRVRDEWETWV